jgi:hypothetical protein
VLALLSKYGNKLNGDAAVIQLGLDAVPTW